MNHGGWRYGNALQPPGRLSHYSGRGLAIRSTGALGTRDGRRRRAVRRLTADDRGHRQAIPVLARAGGPPGVRAAQREGAPIH